MAQSNWFLQVMFNPELFNYLLLPPQLLSSYPRVLLELFGDAASVILGEDQNIPTSLEDCTRLCKQIHMKWKAEEKARGDGGKKSGDGPIQYFS